MSNFGWTYLSRSALARAEAQLSGGAKGVRDEIGFLSLHQHFADRFFPGTSVLHTRLRYALFVPWMFHAIEFGYKRSSAEQAVRSFEQSICERLTNAGETGVIGKLSRGRTMAQPPSAVYWNALLEWGILRDPKNRRPGRRSVAQQAFDLARQPRESNAELASEPDPLPFGPVPPAPADLLTGGLLRFTLLPEERRFLGARLQQLQTREQKPSLLSLLAARVLTGDKASFLRESNCWNPQVLALAREERSHLVSAGHAAALVAIGRGVYAALVERMRHQDGQTATTLHRDSLDEAVAAHRAEALKLDLAQLRLDAPSIPAATFNVLIATQQWLRESSPGLDSLHPAYCAAECDRKHERARLAHSLNGLRRRGEWNTEKNVDQMGRETAETEPLHFRWGVVRQLLTDLHGGGTESRLA